MKNTCKDLTEGNIFKQLISFSIPVFLSNLIQSLYHITDMIIVGHFTGTSGLAAISNAIMLCFTINAFCIGITSGGSVLVAQYAGAKDDISRRESTYALFFVSLTTALLIASAGLIFNETIVKAMNAPEDIINDICAYMRIIYCGTLFIFIYNAVCSVLRALGDSTRPLIFICISAFINVCLDIAFVGKMQLGLKGAAYATVLSQAAAFAVSYTYMQRNRKTSFKLKEVRVKKDKVIKIISVGVPVVMQMLIVNISYLCVAAMLNVYGTVIAAAAGIGLRVNTLGAQFCWAMGQAVTVISGQSLGAGKMVRAAEIVKKGLFLSLVSAFLTLVFIQIFAGKIVLLFGAGSDEVVEKAVLYLRICCSINSLAYNAMYIYDSFAIGAGKSYIAMINSILEAAVIRLSLSWLFGSVLAYGFIGICLGQLLSPFVPAAIGMIFFYKKGWMKKSNSLI